MSCMTILFLNLQITRSDIRPHIKWGVNLVIAYGQFNRLCAYVWVNILTLSPPWGSRVENILFGRKDSLKGCQSADSEIPWFLQRQFV